MTALLRVFAVLIAIRGLTDVFKPLGAGSTMVFFGQLLPATSPVGPIVGVFMLVYTYGLWFKRPFALPMGIVYALFATLNIILFYLFQPLPGGYGLPAYLVFAAVGIGVSWGAVFLLRRELIRTGKS